MYHVFFSLNISVVEVIKLFLNNCLSLYILHVSVLHFFFQNIFLGHWNFLEETLLPSIIQRARDHGLPGYNDVRSAYGLESNRTWDDIFPKNTDDNTTSTLEVNQHFSSYNKIKYNLFSIRPRIVHSECLITLLEGDPDSSTLTVVPWLVNEAALKKSYRTTRNMFRHLPLIIIGYLPCWIYIWCDWLTDRYIFGVIG